MRSLFQRGDTLELRQIQYHFLGSREPTKIRKWAILFTLACTAVPALGAKRITVAQLEQTLVSVHAEPDAKVASQLSNLELTERLSAARLARLEADLPGEKARQELMILADASAFLNLPATDNRHQIG
jgi:hypothetical protein